MALTYTPPGQQGFHLPTFHLTSVDGKSFRDVDFYATERPTKALVVLFICNHCPYVQAIEDRIVGLAREMKSKSVSFVGICANDPTDYPEDAPTSLLERWREKNYEFPYLIDSEQTIAKAFGAVCTPDIFLFDSKRTLCYRGRLDDSWRDATKVKKQELKLAIEAILQGQHVASQNPAMGCSIKWKTSDT